jgi:FAS-associated factor 2
MAFVQDPGNNIILWAGTIQDAEAYQVSTALKVTRLPYTCLIVHTPSVSSTAMSKISTSAGPVVVQDLIAKFRVAMQSQSEELANARRRRQEQQATRNLRQEQESAYERSLAQDREKARKRKEEEAEREKVEREEREKAEQKADLARKLSQWRRWRAQSIAAEPSSESQDAVRISIRLGSGERVIRRFHGNDSLEHLYAFVECHDILGELYEKEASKPETYEHVYGFRLVSPMPREVYDLEKGGSIRDRIGRSGNLIVERIIDDDDDDDEGDENGDQES